MGLGFTGLGDEVYAFAPDFLGEKYLGGRAIDKSCGDGDMDEGGFANYIQFDESLN